MFTIRQFEKTDRDYEKIVSVVNRVWAEYPDTADEWKEGDSRRAAKVKWARFLAEVDGKAVGVGSYGQPLDMYHPNRFWIDLDVLPEHRKQGIGTALYEHLMTQLAPHKPATLCSHTREDYTGGVRFLARHGFDEAMREWESRLDPSTVNLAEWAGYESRMAQAGIELKTVRELESDPDRDRKLYEMEWLVEKDVPAPKPPTKTPFAEWQKIWSRTNLIPDAWWIAVQGGQYVGQTNLWASQARTDLLYTGLTGVVRSHRRRGIASALKIQAVRYAQQKGIGEVRTWNEANNEGMLDINTRLGFVRQPAHIEYLKKLREEPEYVEAEGEGKESN